MIFQWISSKLNFPQKPLLNRHWNIINECWSTDFSPSISLLGSSMNWFLSTLFVGKMLAISVHIYLAVKVLGYSHLLIMIRVVWNEKTNSYRSCCVGEWNIMTHIEIAENSRFKIFMLNQYVSVNSSIISMLIISKVVDYFARNVRHTMSSIAQYSHLVSVIV